MNAEDFDGNSTEFYSTGAFNNVLIYKITAPETLPQEMRFFLALDTPKTEITVGEKYQVLAVFTSNEVQHNYSTGWSNEEHSIISNCAPNNSIGGEQIVDVFLMESRVNPPHDPNDLFMDDHCFCGKNADNSPHYYSYSFIFCNNSTDAPQSKGNVATSAEITFSYPANTFSCIRPRPHTARRVDIMGNTWVLDSLHLLDYHTTASMAESCDTIYFSAFSHGMVKYPDTNKIKVCVVFPPGSGSVCDSTAVCIKKLAPLPTDTVDRYSCDQVPCQGDAPRSFIRDCDGKLIMCGKVGLWWHVRRFFDRIFGSD